MNRNRFIGLPIARIEDAALLTGAGRFVDDVPVLGALEAAFVRSPFAHARIKSIDVAAARAAPAVSAVLAYADIRPLLTRDRMPLELRDEQLPPNATPYPLAKDEVVFAGEAIVAVIAESRHGRRFGLSSDGSERATQFRARPKCRVVRIQPPIHLADERRWPRAAGPRTSLRFE